ncbi:MAG TPA: MFS transporter [Flavisolibacter sp.]|nr:MFS transporter [Flavisolibacter sp.]
MLQASVQLYRNAYTGLSRPIWWLSFVIFINRCGTMVIPFLTVYLIYKGYTIEEAGYVMAAFGAGAIVGSYTGGRLTDKFGFYYIQLFSLLLNGILFIVLGQMHTLLQIAICIFVLSSLGEAFRPANAAAIAAYSNETNRTRCYSLNRLAVNLGWSIGPAVGGILATINYAWLFWVDGLTCIAASLLLYMVMKPLKITAKPKDQQLKIKTNSAYHDRFFLQGMFYILLISICFFQFFSIIPVYYKNIIHLNEAVIGLILASNGILIVLIEMVLVYKLENKRSVFIYITLGSFFMGLSFLILDIAPYFIVILLSMLMLTLGEMLLFPFMNNFWVNRSNDGNRGQYAAVYNISFALGNIIAPTLASQIAARAGFPVLWVIDFILCIFAAAGFFLMKRNNRSYERV